MRTVTLGKESLLTVSTVGLGCMGMVSAYPPKCMLSGKGMKD